MFDCDVVFFHFWLGTITKGIVLSSCSRLSYVRLLKYSLGCSGADLYAVEGWRNKSFPNHTRAAASLKWLNNNNTIICVLMSPRSGMCAVMRILVCSSSSVHFFQWSKHAGLPIEPVHVVLCLPHAVNSIQCKAALRWSLWKLGWTMSMINAGI